MTETTFYEKFKANMELLGMGRAVPRNWFDSTTTATATIAAISRAIQQYGTKVTMREIVMTAPALASAGFALEATTVLAGMLATAYLAACVGSLLVATGQTLAPFAYLPPEAWREVPHVSAKLRGQR